MCLLEASMYEKYRSSHFQSGGSKKFEDWGGSTLHVMESFEKANDYQAKHNGIR